MNTITNEDAVWFGQEFNLLRFNVDHGMQEITTVYGHSAKISTGNSVVSMELPLSSFKELLELAKFGQAEYILQRDGHTIPAVQEAYEKYRTLLNLTAKLS